MRVGVLAWAMVVAAIGVAKADDRIPLALVDEALIEPPQATEPPQTMPAARPSMPQPRRTLTITLGGDLGLGATAAPVDADGARRHGKFLRWHELTAGLRPLLDGDLNFANLETVVTARNDLAPEAKTFVFRTHPEGVRHLAEIGFNLLSTANNHAVDYRLAGMRETIRHLDVLAAEGRILAHAGLGKTRADAAHPRTLDLNGARIAVSAIGISSGGRAGDERPGLMEWRATDDVATAIGNLAKASGDLRILSVHHGEERSVATNSDAIRKLRHQAVLGAGIDIVAGHHAHVVQGIEMTGGRLIFYGLGNLLHPGMQDMGVFDMCRDYGLLARVHLAAERSQRLSVRAVEVVPLTDMHWRARAMSGTPATEQIHVLNRLAAALDDPATGARGLRFAARPDGSGLHCEPGADGDPGRVGALCRDWSGATATPPSLAARIAAACSSRELVARASRPRPLGKPALHPGLRSSASSPPQPAPRETGWSRHVFAGN